MAGVGYIERTASTTTHLFLPLLVGCSCTTDRPSPETRVRSLGVGLTMLAYQDRQTYLSLCVSLFLFFLYRSVSLPLSRCVLSLNALRLNRYLPPFCVFSLCLSATTPCTVSRSYDTSKINIQVVRQKHGPARWTTHRRPTKKKKNRRKNIWPTHSQTTSSDGPTQLSVRAAGGNAVYGITDKPSAAWVGHRRTRG